MYFVPLLVKKYVLPKYKFTFKHEYKVHCYYNISCVKINSFRVDTALCVCENLASSHERSSLGAQYLFSARLPIWTNEGDVMLDLVGIVSLGLLQLLIYNYIYLFIKTHYR